MRITNKPSALVATSNGKPGSCRNCKRDHALYACREFINLKPIERNQLVGKLRLCRNCLKEEHNINKCPSRGCLKCNAKHNTLLHMDQKRVPEYIKSAQSTAPPLPLAPLPTPTDTTVTNLAAHSSQETNTSYVLLATALVHVLDKNGDIVECRAVLDSGSQLNFISEKMLRLLKLPSTKKQLTIHGIGSRSLKAHQRANIKLSSRLTNYTTSMEVFVLSDIASNQPQRFINVKTWPIPNNITLADPEFNKPKNIDLLIGAEFYSELMSTG